MSDEIIEQNEATETSGMPVISPARRKQLDRQFELGKQKHKEKNIDYALELLVQCTTGDVSNVQYLQELIATLKDKYEKTRGKGHPMAFLKMMGPKSATKKALAKEDWKTALEHGIKALVWNPWDFATLRNLVKASQSVGLTDTPLVYIKLALESNPKDIAINRFCGTTLEELGRTNEAYQCWRRIGEMKPDDEEAKQAMTRLTIARTIKETGYTATPSQSASSKVAVKDDAGATLEMTHEERLEYQIKQQPKNASLYLQLGDMFIQVENFVKAENVLKRGVDSCGPGDGMQDKLEDVQIRLMRQRMSKVDRNSDEWKKLRLEMNETELGIWKNRCDRYPNNLGFKYDLGLRYQMKGDNDEAIKQFQISKKEPRRAGLSCLALGQCFQAIKQFSLAMANYQEAIEKIPDRNAEDRKKSLYLAGKLAMTLKEYEQANDFLTRLADMDFGYKDVSDLLAEVEKLRQA